jgi:hypothetical protein
MRTLITIGSLVLIACTLVYQKSEAQANATAMVTATVLPSVSMELARQNSIAVNKEERSSQVMKLRGTENILIIVDSKESKSEKTVQLINEKPAVIPLPASSGSVYTTIVYLSS